MNNKTEQKTIEQGITWGYVRVSSTDGSQIADRQIIALENFGVDREYIITDMASGKNFTDRPNYQKLVGNENEQGLLRRGDTLVIKELDRLGRNRAEVKQQLELLKTKGVRCKVLDVPTTLMDIGEGQEWILDMINNILIEVLGSIAEQERIKINTRQREGIDAMPVNEEGVRVSKKKGKGKYGRPKLELPENFESVYNRVQNGGMSLNEAFKILEIKRSTYYKYAKELKNKLENNN